MSLLRLAVGLAGRQHNPPRTQAEPNEAEDHPPCYLDLRDAAGAVAVPGRARLCQPSRALPVTSTPALERAQSGDQPAPRLLELADLPVGNGLAEAPSPYGQAEVLDAVAPAVGGH